MLNSADAYAVAWTVYAVSFVVAYFAFARLTRGLRPVILRQTLKAFLIVLFLTPVRVEGTNNWFAPAWLEGGYEAILGEPTAASEAFFNLTVAAVLMLVILVIDTLWRRRRSA